LYISCNQAPNITAKVKKGATSKMREKRQKQLPLMPPVIDHPQAEA